MALVILVFSIVLGAVSGAELPSFLKKCSLSGDVEECIKNNGNEVIERLIREGDPLLNAPKAAPLHISDMILPGSDFVATLKNIQLEGLENTTITSVRFKMEAKSEGLNFTNPVLVLSADYSISDNNFFFPSVRGGGQFKMFLDDNNFNYSCDVSRTTINGEVYLKMENHRVDLTTKRIRYNFNRLYADNAADYFVFLNNHKQLVDETIRPAVERIIRNYIFTIAAFIQTVPLNKIFDE